MKTYMNLPLVALLPALVGCAHNPNNATAPSASNLALSATDPTPANVVDVSIVTTGGGPNQCGTGWKFTKLLTSHGPGSDKISVRDRGNLDLSLLLGPNTVQVNFNFVQPFNYWYQSTTINNLAISAAPSYPDPNFAAPWPPVFTPAAQPVSANQKTLTFFDNSGDGRQYNYALQFYTGTQRCVIDPQVQNGGHVEDDGDDGKKKP
jgi:hypothetical protein